MAGSRRTDAEFLVEPFNEGSPGPHVTEAVAAVEAHGLGVDVGPFGSVVQGDIDDVAGAMADMARAAIDHGADRVTVTYRRVPGGSRSRPAGGLHDALARIVAAIEIELGASLDDLDRTGKQAAVRRLDESGAFLLKRSVEDVAEMMGVSRITIYNYLNAIRED